MDFDKLNSDVMNIDPDIRYAAIQNDVGEKICDGFRSNIEPILDEAEIKMMHHYASQRWQTRKNIEHKIGKTKYAMAEYDKLKRMTFPIDKNHLLMITAEIKADHVKIINKVLSTINDNKNN